MSNGSLGCLPDSMRVFVATGISGSACQIVRSAVQFLSQNASSPTTQTRRTTVRQASCGVNEQCGDGDGEHAELKDPRNAMANDVLERVQPALIPLLRVSAPHTRSKPLLHLVSSSHIKKDSQSRVSTSHSMVSPKMAMECDACSIAASVPAPARPTDPENVQRLSPHVIQVYSRPRHIVDTRSAAY